MISPIHLFAQIKRRQNCSEAQANNNCVSVLPEVKANEEQVQNGLAVIFGLLAAMAIIVIIIGAINMATAEGNPENISKAKKTILYALIGLVIALSAEAIVLLVVGRL